MRKKLVIFCGIPIILVGLSFGAYNFSKYYKQYRYEILSFDIPVRHKRELLDFKIDWKEKQYPIDLVYLWVDGYEEKLRAKRDAWRVKLGKPVNKKTDLDMYNHYMEHNELKYSLRSVEKFAPWIRKIYIVTHDQVPVWLNTSNPKVEIVNQDDLLPKDAVPAFNSVTLEHYISNIKGLSEHFLYANDDMMFANYVTPENFFKDGKPIYTFLAWDCSLGQCFNVLYDTGSTYLILGLKSKNLKFKKGFITINSETYMSTCEYIKSVPYKSAIIHTHEARDKATIMK